MADDPVTAARRREQRMLARSTYFPAANLRQFEGTELAPPGGGTYYNPSRYAGATYGNRQMAQRNLAGAYQSDLAFNVMHNPRQAQGLEAERIGAQYGGKSRAGQPGYQTVTLPSGGTTVVTDREASRLARIPGYSVGAATRPDPATAYQLGFSGQPQFTGGSAFQRSYAQGFNPREAGVTQPDTSFGYQIGQSIGKLGTLGYNAIASLFRGSQPRFASEQSDLRNEIEGTFYGGGQAPPPTPTPTPQSQPRFLAMTQPMRYFDF
jgi:hypothetical protein